MTNNEKLRSLTLTLVRHGESVDNLKPIWAGHRDATLSHFGHSQAVRLGDFFKNQTFHRIFCSDLKRANLTANQIFQQNLKRQKISTKHSGLNSVEYVQDKDTKAMELIKITPQLREQYFGKAEGERYDTGNYTSGEYYSNRSFKFADGESREDVMERARKFITQILVAEWVSIIESESPHFCLVSHGIFLSEFIGALNDLFGIPAQSGHPDHFSNTGWTRILLTANFIDNQLESFVKIETLASNQVSHLIGLERQPGGIGSASWDPKQSNLDSFFTKTGN